MARNQYEQSPSPSRHARRRVQRRDDELLFEACERRLVLSAQLLFDVLGDQALDVHGEASGPSIDIEPNLQSAHAISGVDAVSNAFGLSGAGQTVAVIDSGIAWDHVALGEGYGPGYRVVGGWDFAENDDRPYDDGPTGFHGTHVSGIIGSDHETHQGVAPEVDFVSLRVFDDAGQGELAWVESALQWVHDNQHSFENPITTVNISIGTVWNSESLPEWANLEEELQQLYEDGIVVTASAGNSFQDYNQVGLSYPSASPRVLPVASIDDDGQISDFSQRSNRVLAAPGSNIFSSVPDHVLGRDGRIDDFSGASGTSMASPYVAGASVLVREAMELAGWGSITVDSITNHLRDTADSVFDSATGLTYDVLNVQNAIESILPSDSVGDDLQSASSLDLTSTTTDTWLNSLSDTDVYSFVASANGTLEVDLESQFLDTASWSLFADGQQISTGAMEAGSVELVAGQSYEFRVAASDAIGPLSIGLEFEESSDPGNGSGSGGNTGGGSSVADADLGSVDYLEQSVASGSIYSATATQDGTFTVVWNNPSSASGAVHVSQDGTTLAQSSNWQDGSVRLDFQVQAGQELQISVPGIASDDGQLVIANLLEQAGSTVHLGGTLNADEFSLSLQNGVSVSVGQIEYALDPLNLQQLNIDGDGSNDSIQVVGATGSDKVDLRPGSSTIVSGGYSIALESVEEVSYTSGGGPDRVYLYDSDTDDTLTARPREAELVGVGYRFSVEEVDRIFIHATGGGQDFAYLYDSDGDDRLSVRPQFTSITGEGFFNYVRGFERVYAYANAGGSDTADLYDSENDDRFSTSGVSASIVGPGFSSFTRSFEQVNAHASAGGNDLATLYGSGQQTNWQQGSDFVSFSESSWQREARGFRDIETYVDNLQTDINALAREQFGDTAVASSSIETQAQSIETGVSQAPGFPAETTYEDFGSASSDAGNEYYSQFADEFAGPSRGFDLAELSVDTDAVQFEELHRELDYGQQMRFDSAAATESLWQTFSDRELHESRLHLPEERLMEDEELEQSVLDEAFSLFGEMFE